MGRAGRKTLILFDFLITEEAVQTSYLKEGQWATDKNKDKEYLSNIKSQHVCVLVCVLPLFETEIQKNQIIRLFDYLIIWYFDFFIQKFKKSKKSKNLKI